MSFKKNKLTEKLIKEGYTAENHPTWVKVGGNSTKPTLDNFEGGFIYKRYYLEEKTFQTPCGLKCRYKSTFDNLSYNGVDFTYENGMALINCPKGCTECQMRHDSIKDITGVGKHWCAVSISEDPYEYQGSVEELNDIAEQERRNKRDAFLKENKNACINHMKYDGNEWHYEYDVFSCTRQKCSNIINGTCPVFPQNKDKGNVFYDLVISYTRDEDKGTLFEGKVYTEITKGKQYFDAPVSLTLATIVATKHPDEILNKEKGRYSQELFYAEYHGRYFTVDVQNIRAAKKEVRDLEQDIADMEAGINVSHHRDVEKGRIRAKKEHRANLAEKRKIALRKKLVKCGYENLEQYSIDKKHADLWFTPDELDAISKERSTLIGAGIKQMNIFDLLGQTAAT